ncbi:MAG: hypothetical protein IKW96_06790 [Ruminococcus sp.]|uniref:hypothetical protein n=1 Tax=Ruminococcus sp. TaxID=41978 RepID=UPI0025E50683|nr:hypothetical protein [Ruminococcus sp.]MBR5682970.1 hypothetical protein [Ruminococcus sp.]
MVNYGTALARAKAIKTNWNEEEYIAKALITWADSDYEYELEVENEGESDNEFTAWIEENAEALAREAAEAKGRNFDELIGIDYENDYIDDDAAFDEGYWAACEE